MPSRFSILRTCVRWARACASVLPGSSASSPAPAPAPLQAFTPIPAPLPTAAEWAAYVSRELAEIFDAVNALAPAVAGAAPVTTDTLHHQDINCSMTRELADEKVNNLVLTERVAALTEHIAALQVEVQRMHMYTAESHRELRLENAKLKEQLAAAMAAAANTRTCACTSTCTSTTPAGDSSDDGRYAPAPSPAWVRVSDTDKMDRDDDEDKMDCDDIVGNFYTYASPGWHWESDTDMDCNNVDNIHNARTCAPPPGQAWGA